jgi:F1F0 ATPase subunit 2
MDQNPARAGGPLMPAPFTLVLLLLTGLGLGFLFYGGLWLTVRALPKSRHPTALFLASFWGRNALAIAGLILAMDSRWERAVICMVGFVLSRVLLGRWIPRNGVTGKSLV